MWKYYKYNHYRCYFIDKERYTMASEYSKRIKEQQAKLAKKRNIPNELNQNTEKQREKQEVQQIVNRVKYDQIMMMRGKPNIRMSTRLSHNRNMYYGVEREDLVRGMGNTINVNIYNNKDYPIYIQNSFNNSNGLIYAGKAYGSTIDKYSKEYQEAYENNPSTGNYEKSLEKINSNFVINVYNDNREITNNIQTEASANKAEKSVDQTQSQNETLETVDDLPQNFNSTENEPKTKPMDKNTMLKSFLVNEFKANRCSKEFFTANEKMPENLSNEGVQTMMKMNKDIHLSDIGLNGNDLIAKKGSYINITDDDLSVYSEKFVNTYFNQTKPDDPQLQRVIDKLDLNTTDFDFHTKQDVDKILESSPGVDSYEALADALDNATQKAPVFFEKFSQSAIENVKKLESLSADMKAFNQDMEFDNNNSQLSNEADLGATN